MIDEDSDGFIMNEQHNLLKKHNYLEIAFLTSEKKWIYYPKANKISLSS